MLNSKNLQLKLTKILVAWQEVNTNASQAASEMGYLVAGQLSDLYSYWNGILEKEVDDDSQFSIDNQKAQNHYSQYQAIVTSINTTVTNLANQLKQLSAFSSTIVQFIQTIASYSSTKLG